MLRVHKRRLLSSSCSTVGRSVKALELLHCYRSVSGLCYVDVSLWVPTVEASRQSTNTTARVSKTIDLHQHHSFVFLGASTYLVNTSLY